MVTHLRSGGLARGGDLRYALRVTNGTGRPGIAWDQIALPANAALGGGDADFLLAPGAPLTLQDAQVATHQISVVIPVR